MLSSNYMEVISVLASTETCMVSFFTGVLKELAEKPLTRGWAEAQRTLFPMCFQVHVWNFALKWCLI